MIQYLLGNSQAGDASVEVKLESHLNNLQMWFVTDLQKMYLMRFFAVQTLKK